MSVHPSPLYAQAVEEIKSLQVAVSAEEGRCKGFILQASVSTLPSTLSHVPEGCAMFETNSGHNPATVGQPHADNATPHACLFQQSSRHSFIQAAAFDLGALPHHFRSAALVT